MAGRQLPGRRRTFRASMMRHSRNTPPTPKENCPVSKALAGIEIRMNAGLALSNAVVHLVIQTFHLGRVKLFVFRKEEEHRKIHRYLFETRKPPQNARDRKSTRLNSSHQIISYAV